MRPLATLGVHGRFERQLLIKPPPPRHSLCRPLSSGRLQTTRHEKKLTRAEHDDCPNGQLPRVPAHQVQAYGQTGLQNKTAARETHQQSFLVTHTNRLTTQGIRGATNNSPQPVPTTRALTYHIELISNKLPTTNPRSESLVPPQ